MSFLEELKNVHSLKQKAEEMQAQLANEKVTGQSGNGVFCVVMNGNQEVLSVTIPDSGYGKEETEAGIKEAFADARGKVENILKNKMMGGMLG